MQIKFNTVNEDELIYPYVAKLQDSAHTTVVLFTGEREGVCLFSTEPLNIVGEVSYSWTEEAFKRCSVTLF